ncbi:uncharacterized protein LOC124146294 [Haliotis rufescens]|uniref:uncharacterized protein LOC124146294 n=1 Tax=Haliotis rufescens TaxID=6454 RepID=UPI00201EB245|nr:uncharacterized protein LOC124146294 [Haliotis rufescens]XP_048256049.1 uncharacterized protein LOC124146294 [Haliotis rufescens]
MTTLDEADHDVTSGDPEQRKTSDHVDSGCARNWSRFKGIRNCHGKLSEVVSSVFKDSDPPRHRTTSESDISRQVSHLQKEMEKQSEGQASIKQSHDELKKTVLELKDSVTSRSCSVGDIFSQEGPYCTSTPAPRRVFSRTSSSTSVPAFCFTSGTTSDFSELSSCNSGCTKSMDILRQRDTLETCLSREMLRNVERHLEDVKLRDQQLSDDMAQLMARVKDLWRLKTRDKRNRGSYHSLVNADHRTDPLPPHIQAFCMKLEDVIHVRVSDLARYLNVSDMGILEGNNASYRSLFWGVIQQWNMECQARGSPALLETLIDACQKCGVQHPLKVEPMPVHHRRILEQNYSFLAEHVMVPLLLTYLRDSGFLTNDLVQYVLQPDPRPDKVHRLVDIMTVFGKKSLNLLQDALRRSDQGHIADMLVCRDDEAFEPDQTASALPSESVRLQESLKCQLKELNISTDQIRRQKEVCQVPSWKLWSGLFLNLEVSVKIPHHTVNSLRLLIEANHLRNFKHDHIVQLFGVSMQTDPPWIITESVTGNLLNHIRGMQGMEVSASIILGMATQLSSAMVHLEGKECIHGDLRAENVLMTDKKTLKVANFHVTIPSDKTDEMANYSRWSAPEVINSGVRSTKADVWAYGILLWELVTLGMVPYPDFAIDLMADKVLRGYVMPHPRPQFQAPFVIFDIMKRCWRYHTSERPNFKEVDTELTNCLEKRNLGRERPRHNMLNRGSRRSSVDSRRDSVRRQRRIRQKKETQEGVLNEGLHVPIGAQKYPEKDDCTKKEEKMKKKSIWERLGLVRKKKK